MKTATELADRLSHGYPSTERKEAAAMLLQQAEQQSAWLAANGPGGWIDDLRNRCEALEITNAALKADAERFVTLSECVISSDLSHDLGVAETVDEVRAAIDAMKGKS